VDFCFIVYRKPPAVPGVQKSFSDKQKKLLMVSLKCGLTTAQKEYE